MLGIGLMAWTVVMVAGSAPSAQPTTCAITDLPGLSRQFASIAGSTAETRAGRTAEFARLAAAILGREPDAGVDWASRGGLPCDPAVRQRDRVAAQMAMVGYSAKEIADVLAGHLTLADLKQARLRLMAGQPRVAVADFLDARWREPEAPTSPAAIVASSRRVTLPIDLDAELNQLADLHRVPAALVRAMVAAESGGNARALSSAGAIGLMQLMPATAAALGVDPWHPTENLRGGITYLADLLREYGGNPRLALIAYNAGPQHANRVRAGTAVAYRETRRYLDAVAAHYPLP
jgi:soluble lytic murein transglycosylase-like protein